MNKKTLIILGALSVGGCCVLGSGLLALGLLAPDGEQAQSAEAAAAPPVAGVGDYIIWGSATPVAEGFAESLVGNWAMMDGATSIESLETISEDVIRVRNNRSGELWHFIFGADSTYAFRYVITYNRRALISVERGEWSSDGAQLTLAPASCTEKTASETTDCLEPAPRTYALTTVRMEELMPNDTQGASWTGVALAGPTPKFAAGANQASLRLMRVR